MKIEKEIKKIIKSSDNVFITGHKNLDLDAIGVCVGISAICNGFNKKSYIIVDDEQHELGVAKILLEIKDTKSIIRSSEIPDFYKKNSILIIVDTNKAHLLQNNKILHYFNKIIILDHHQQSDQTIPNTINIIDECYSSASEIVTTLIKDYKLNISKEDATILLSGIELDTHNFAQRTFANTFYAAYYLLEQGASNKKVRFYLKEDLKDYIIRHKVIMDTKILDEKFALAVASEKEEYKREELAKIADALLNFEGIKASFVLGKRVDGGIGISARSEGSVDVGKITEKLGGGGDMYNAACQIQNADLKQIEKELKEVLKED